MLKVQQCVTADRIPRKKPYSCDRCCKWFETPSKLARHFLIHTGQKPFECHVCHKTFRQLVHLERHRLTHNLPFQCIVCFRSFKNLITFLKHQQLHNENFQNGTKQAENSVKSEQERVTSGILQCSTCWKSFLTEERWMLHQCLKADHLHRARRRKKTHTCESCNKVFPSRSKLERHFLIHTGQKPFKCSSCGKSFRQSTHLKIHQLTHTEEKPFQCCFCQKGFKIQSKLMKHKQLHTRNKTFSNAVYKAKTLKYPRPHNLLEGKRGSFENADTCESQENDPCDAHLVYIVPFQCPTCEQCFETEQVLNLHKCCLKDGKGSKKGAAACSRTVSVKSTVLKKLKHTGGKATEFSLTERKTKKLGPFKSPDLVAAEDQCSDQCASAKPFQDSLSKLDTCKMPSKRIRRTLPWQECPQPPDSGTDSKGALGGEGALNTGDSMDTKHSASCGSSGDGVFVKPAVLDSAFSASAENSHKRHKVCKCDRCEKIFLSSSKLKRHYLIHTGQKPFGCGVCGKTFRQSAHLKRHQLTHTEKRPSKSPVCQGELENLKKLSGPQGDRIKLKYSLPMGYSGNLQTPSQASGFQEPEVTESTQVPEVKAEIKSGDFALDTSSSNTQPYLPSKLLQTQQNSSSCSDAFAEGTGKAEVVNKLYQCSICSKSFKSPSKLERHYLMHAGQKPFECLTCGRKFRQAPHLKRHHLTHSKESLKLSSTVPENIFFSKVNNDL